MRAPLYSSPDRRSRVILSDRVSRVTAPEEASLRAGLGVSCWIGMPGNPGAPALMVLALVVEHFRDFSSAFHPVTD